MQQDRHLELRIVSEARLGEGMRTLSGVTVRVEETRLQQVSLLKDRERGVRQDQALLKTPRGVTDSACGGSTASR